jgi:hypothetical protein
MPANGLLFAVLCAIASHDERGDDTTGVARPGSA